MKLIIAIVQDQDSIVLIDELNNEGYRVTKLASTGGFLRDGNTTLLIGVEDDYVNNVIDIIKTNAKRREITSTMMSVEMQGDAYFPFPVEVTVGGATIFVLSVEEYIKIKE